MTALVVSLASQSREQLRADVYAAADAGADAVELRLDLMDGVSDDDIRALRDSGPALPPIILTIRSTAEGGAYDGDDADRVCRLIELGPVADYIDVELALWRRSANLRQKVGLALRRAGHASQSGGIETIEQARARKLILSRHDPLTRPATLQADFLAMVSDPVCRVAKLAWRARSIRDNFEAFEVMRGSPAPAIVICLGDTGVLSRVLARKFGAFATFARLDGDLATAPGQLTIGELKSTYRWDAMSASTVVYGVVGDPVVHSLGPCIHNAVFAREGLDALYLPMQVAPGYESFKAFMVEVLARPWLDFRGFSITRPHKENAFRFLREASAVIDPVAERLQAVNTICLDPDGALRGTNTDYVAIRALLEQSLREPARMAEQGRSAAVLGAGGVARAAVAALIDLGLDVVIQNRNAARAAALAAELGGRTAPWDQRPHADAAIVVNCTSCGQWPAGDVSPVPPEKLHSGLLVLDTVYHPPKTRLLREAAALGCPVIDGLAVFLRQAGAQFTAWQGRQADFTALRSLAEARLERQQTVVERE